ncbi:anti-sigma factor [Bacteroidia bacterium]|nr:anti-sigma factor [Bacteroidia bacterium]
MFVEKDIDLIIARHFGGTASPQETQSLQEWLLASEKNRAFFSTLVSKQKVNTHAAWGKVSEYIHRVSTNRPVIWLRPALRYAAAIALLVGLSALGYTILWQPAPTILATVESVETAQQHTLQDSSSVFLNKDSRLSYIGNYGKGKRELQLTGEAFFEVAPLGEGQFLVHAEEVLIKDIGTAFNVQAYPASDSIIVFVQHGEVQFYTLTNEGLTLHAGETGIFDKRTKAFTRTAGDANAIAYKTHLFVFHNTPLGKAIADISKVYNVHIALADPALAAHTISVTFENESIEEIVGIIGETLDLRATTSPKKGTSTEQEWILE